MGTTRRGAQVRGGSADRGDANLTLTLADAAVQRFLTALTADRTVTLPGTAPEGKEFVILRIGLGPGKLKIGTIEEIPPYTAAAASIRGNGTAWEPFFYAEQVASGMNFHNQGAGALFGAWGDGDPGKLANEFSNQSNTVAFPTQATLNNNVARCVKFRLPKKLTVTNVRTFSNAAFAAASGVSFGIYPVGTATARVWQSGNQATLANAWNSHNANTPFDLQPNTDYWFCWAGLVATGTGVPYRTFSPPIASAVFGADAAPLGAKLNLGVPVLGQFTVTAGAMPATLPTVAAAAYITPGTSGGMIPAWLEGTAA